MAFLIFHLLSLGVFLVPWDATALWLVVGTYFGRMFFITAGYHRFFSHRAFATSRVFQFIIAFMAMTSSQKGVLWWSSHHRHHHRHSDKPQDVHSPARGFFWSHCAWFLSSAHEKYNPALIRDFSKFPELRWLEKNWSVPVFAYGFVLLFTGGWTFVLWGLCVSTVLLWHGTFTINSLAHLWGRRRYDTGDDSKNNPWLAVITLGEGWHNNHHQYPVAARNGFFWWELDLTYYLLRFLSALGLIWELKPVPAQIYAGRAENGSSDQGAEFPFWPKYETFKLKKH